MKGIGRVWKYLCHQGNNLREVTGEAHSVGKGPLGDEYVVRTFVRCTKTITLPSDKSVEKRGLKGKVKTPFEKVVLLYFKVNLCTSRDDLRPSFVSFSKGSFGKN